MNNVELFPGMAVQAYELPDEARIERIRQADDSYMWAVRKDRRCLNGLGEWEYEPMPSHRTDEFRRRCRFKTVKEAYDIWVNRVEQHA